MNTGLRRSLVQTEGYMQVVFSSCYKGNHESMAVFSCQEYALQQVDNNSCIISQKFGSPATHGTVPQNKGSGGIAFVSLQLRTFFADFHSTLPEGSNLQLEILFVCP